MSFTEEITTLAFNWGGTLMLEDPHFDGPMIDWPEVHAIEGAQATLEALKGHYRLVVASNAANSNAELARKVLARVGLDGFFSHIFTYRDLKVRKPEPAYFRKVESSLGVAPHQVLMVGDSFWVDVLGAHEAGWRAAWFNPSGEACPGLTPPHVAELTRLEQLPIILSRELLPEVQTCHTWCLEQGFTFEAWQHVSLVAAIAYQAAVWLRARGLDVNPVLAQRGGLVHDIAKFSAPQINPQVSHAEVGASLMREYGQPALAEIARRHMIRLAETDKEPRTWEEKLVHFADRLADGPRLVTLDERLNALAQRYPHNADVMRSQRDYEASLQAEICSAAGLATPAAMFDALQSALRGNR